VSFFLILKNLACSFRFFFRFCWCLFSLRSKSGLFRGLLIPCFRSIAAGSRTELLWGGSSSLKFEFMKMPGDLFFYPEWSAISELRSRFKFLLKLRDPAFPLCLNPYSAFTLDILSFALFISANDSLSPFVFLPKVVRLSVSVCSLDVSSILLSKLWAFSLLYTLYPEMLEGYIIFEDRASFFWLYNVATSPPWKWNWPESFILFSSVPEPSWMWPIY